MEKVYKYEKKIINNNAEEKYISFAGDLCLTEDSGRIEVSEQIRELLYNTEGTLLNFECPITNGQKPINKSGFNLSSSESAIDLMKNLKVDIAMMANNHIMDFGKEAMFSTIDLLENSGIKTVGVGKNQKEAIEPLILDINNSKVAIIAMCEREFSNSTLNSAGTAEFDLILAHEIVAKLKSEVDIIIFSIHGGNELYPIPSPRIQKKYRHLVDIGADVVIGHHPHTIQGVEIYKNSPIVYSLGNFVFEFPYSTPDCWKKGLIARVGIENKKISSLSVYGVNTKYENNNIFVDLAKKDDKFKETILRLNEICSDKELVEQFWLCFCKDKMDSYLNLFKICSSCLPGSLYRQVRYATKFRKFFYSLNIFADKIDSLFQPEKNKRLQLDILKNYLNCPSHLDVLKTINEILSNQYKSNINIEREYKKLMKNCV